MIRIGSNLLVYIVSWLLEYKQVYADHQKGQFVESTKIMLVADNRFKSLPLIMKMPQIILCKIFCHLNISSMNQDKLDTINNKLAKGKAAEYWPYFDVNGNGYLSLAEVDKGVRDVIQLPQLFELKPVLIRAFNAAKTTLKAATSHGDDYVSKAEFKYLLQYLREYSNYWFVFNQIDTSKDRRVSLAEFEKAVPLLQERGLKVPDAKSIFQKIDTNNGGYILFDEFCHYVIANRIEIEE